MKKDELYDPEKTGSFQMMFGFSQPTSYVRKKWIPKAKVTTSSIRIKNEI